jgi:hypothetical protein
VKVVPDSQYAGMWWVQLASGLSDMTNLSRAKDAAAAEAGVRMKRQESNQWAE